MVRLVWRTDVHMSDQAPSSRKDDWTATVLGKLRQVGLVADKIGADAVLDGGDFFHVKSPLQNSHSLIRRVVEAHAAYPCPVFANVGNHDCVWGDYTYLHQQPLEVLFSTGVFRRCYDEHEAVFEKDGVRVRVIGIPYHGTTYDLERFRRIKRGDEDHLVCIAHLLASPSGGTMFEGEDIVKYSDLTAYAPDVFCFGHWHKDQGVTKVGAKTIVNIGSLTRGALSQDEMQRQPACGVLTFTKQDVQVKVVRLKVAPAVDVFDVEGRVRAEKRSEMMDTFVESMRQKIVMQQGRGLDEIVREMELPQAQGRAGQVRERVLSYLERAEGSRT